MHANAWTPRKAAVPTARLLSRATPYGVVAGLGLLAFAVMSTALAEGNSIESHFSKRDATIDPKAKRIFWSMPHLEDEDVSPLKRQQFRMKMETPAWST